MSKQIHILGISGTFMAGVARLAKELGYEVSGSDLAIYPPMSDQLAELEIRVFQGYEDYPPLSKEPDHWVIGNVMRRGMPVIEKLLNDRKPFTSGPEWLSQHVLRDKKVLAVSGTHGKTTTSSMLAWILEVVGLNPGFLIGGIPLNFSSSARMTDSDYFVVEADEYDSAFFDKRSKFVHYRPWVLVVNNIEFDHADIFPDLKAIQNQFHHCIRTVPSLGSIVYPRENANVAEVIQKGCWSEQITFVDRNVDQGWGILHQEPSGSRFTLSFDNQPIGEVHWGLLGQHNIQNALAALAAAIEIGVKPEKAIEALCGFKGVKRRLEIKADLSGVVIYDDFAHHPTAIEMTLSGLRAKVGQEPITAIIDIGSNTMKAGHMSTLLPGSVKLADEVFFFHQSDLPWDVDQMFDQTGKRGGVFSEVDQLVERLKSNVKKYRHILFMSNGSFSGIHQKFISAITSA